MALTYWNYLKLSDLLELQEAQSAPAEHDETLFIVIHQVYELWFKLVDLMDRDGCHSVGRCLERFWLNGARSYITQASSGPPTLILRDCKRAVSVRRA